MKLKDLCNVLKLPVHVELYYIPYKEYKTGVAMHVLSYKFICSTSTDALGIKPYNDYEVAEILHRQTDLVILLTQKEEIDEKARVIN